MSELDSKINEYVDAFHKSVPLFIMPPISTEELIELIDKHIKSGKPIEVDVDPNVIY